MSRRAFGGDAASIVVNISPTTLGLTAKANATVTMWSAATAGVQYTDLKAADGTTSITSVVTGADGLLPQFFGPDGIQQMWANAPGAAERVLLLPTDSGSVYMPITSGATVIELLGTGSLFGAALQPSGTDSFPIFVAPFPCKITQFALFTKTAVAASDTNYWTIALRKKNGASLNTIAQKTTQATGGQAVAANVEWNYDTVSWDPTNQTFAKGDGLDIAFFLTGSAAGIQFQYMAFTFRYEPI